MASFQQAKAKELFFAELLKKYDVIVDESVKTLMEPPRKEKNGWVVMDPARLVTSWSASFKRHIEDAFICKRLDSRMNAFLTCPLRTKWRTSMVTCTAVFSVFLVPTIAFTHEVRPAYLELHEDKAGEFSILWKTPARGERRLALTPEFSGTHQNITPLLTRQTENSAVQTWNIRSLESLRGQTLRIRELEGTMTDVLVRTSFLDGSSWVQRLTPGNPMATVPEVQSAWEVASQYSILGVKHILLGIDHLLFVLALVMITRGTMRLVKTITAFTLAHSITPGLATLGFVHVPSKPVEALIALSIVLVAAEIIHARRRVEGYTVCAPWVMACVFGLLHGFGFAGALSEVGLPEGHIPMALLFFKIGVEAGQLLFIAAVLSFITLFRPIRMPSSPWVELVPPYVIGSVTMFWVIQRVALF